MTQKSVAVLFPGQGSQSVGMLSELAAAYPDIRETFSAASDTLGYDLWALAQEGPEEKIRQTQFTQPLMYASGVAVYRIWNQLVPGATTVMAGHSLGEFCALTASGALTFEQGMPLVAERARLMAGSVPEGEGGMAAILGLDDDSVVAVCESVSGDRIVEAVNFNSPGQVAISGHLDAVERACEVAREKGARKAMMLPVSVPNHSALMQDAGAKLADIIDAIEFKGTQVPVIQNTEAAIATDTAQMLGWLKQHVFRPVWWTQSYQRLLSEFTPDVVIEPGPGKVLTGLGKRIDRGTTVYPLDTPESLEKALDALR